MGGKCDDVKFLLLTAYFFYKGVKKIRILGIDQSTTISGLCLFEDGKIADCKEINLKKHKDKDNRVKEMLSLITQYIKNTAPDVVYVEDTAMQSNANIFRMLSQLQGMIMGYCFAQDIPVLVIKPTEWRKALGFKQGRLKRAELKEQAVEYVGNVFGINPSIDVCEAVCIAQAAFLIEGEKENF